MKSLKALSCYLWMGLSIFCLSQCYRAHCPKDQEVKPVPPVVVPPLTSASPSEIINWTVKNSSITTDLFSVSATSDDTAYMTGVGGFIYKTINGGNSLILLNSGTSQSLYSILFLNANTGFAAGNGSTILTTTNAGVTWTPVSSPITANYRKIFFLDANIGFIVGGVGSMIKTTNGGLNWFPMATPTSEDLHGVCFTDVNTGYISGQQYTMLKTTDGGVNWSLLNTGLTNGNVVTPLASIFFTSADTGYAVGGHSYATGTTVNALIKTTDAGVTWVKQPNPDSTNVLMSVKFIDSNIGYIAASDMANNKGLILKTTNGGATWAVQATSPLQKLYCLDLFSTGMGYAVGINGGLLKGNF